MIVVLPYISIIVAATEASDVKPPKVAASHTHHAMNRLKRAS
jgi:hypothetical protein